MKQHTGPFIQTIIQLFIFIIPVKYSSCLFHVSKEWGCNCIIYFFIISFYFSQSANQFCEVGGERPWALIWHIHEKLLRSTLGEHAATFLLEGVLILCDAFDEDVFVHSCHNVIFDFLTAFRCLKRYNRSVVVHILDKKTVQSCIERSSSFPSETGSDGQINLPTTSPAWLHF